MINLGIIDLLLLVILVIALAYSLRGHNLLPFAAILVIVLLIELERLAPGTLVALGKAIHEIDAINERLPHIQISPIVTIRS